MSPFPSVEPDADPIAEPTATSGPTASAAEASARARAARLATEVAGSAGEVAVQAPASGRLIASVRTATADDVAEAYRRARTAQQRWAAAPASYRAGVADRLVDLMLSRRDEGLDLVQLETGKARMHAFEELLEGILSAQYYARRTPRILRPRARQGTFPGLTRAVELHHPRGVVAVISPWNYPLALSMDVLPALLAGNAVVHKPDVTTPFSALWLRDLMIESGLDPELWQVVIGDPAVIGDPLVDAADYLAFTGSTAAGLKLSARCGERMIGCSLELGGKNPMVVLDDADLDLAARVAVRGCFGSAGQLCVGIERILVDTRVHAAFVHRFTARVRELRLGAPLDWSTDVGSLVGEKQLDRVSGAVERARAAGGSVLVGGRARPDLGPYFYEPTVVTDLPADAELECEETFGPVVTIREFRGDEDAIRQANDTRYGLNAAVFGRDARRARRVAEQIDAGTVSVNEAYAAAYGSQGAPMGGRKLSGTGRRHGPGGLLRFTEAQTVAAQHVIGFDPPAGLSTKTYADLLTTAVKLMKRVRLR